jgi:hypothetical protein
MINSPQEGEVGAWERWTCGKDGNARKEEFYPAAAASKPPLKETTPTETPVETTPLLERVDAHRNVLIKTSPRTGSTALMGKTFKILEKMST